MAGRHGGDEDRWRDGASQRQVALQWRRCGRVIVFDTGGAWGELRARRGGGGASSRQQRWLSAMVLRGGDDGVVASGNPGEALRLEARRYTTIRHQSIEEEAHTGRISPKTEKSSDLLGHFVVKEEL
jgi:hypothetical protein